MHCNSPGESHTIPGKLYTIILTQIASKCIINVCCTIIGMNDHTCRIADSINAIKGRYTKQQPSENIFVHFIIKTLQIKWFIAHSYKERNSIFLPLGIK